MWHRRKYYTRLNNIIIARLWWRFSALNFWHSPCLNCLVRLLHDRTMRTPHSGPKLLSSFSALQTDGNGQQLECIGPVKRTSHFVVDYWPKPGAFLWFGSWLADMSRLSFRSFVCLFRILTFSLFQITGQLNSSLLCYCLFVNMVWSCSDLDFWHVDFDSICAILSAGPREFQVGARKLLK
jgi:hypothetical protein